MFKSTESCRSLLKCLSINKTSIKQLTNYGWQIEKYYLNEEFNKKQIKFNSNFKQPIIYNPNDLLIEVKAASVNPLDLVMIKGYGREIIDNLNVINGVTKCKLTYDKFPLVLGRDFTGIVKSVGGNVNKFKVGDKVWGSISPFKQGTHCKYVVASENELTLKPTNLSFEEAASIPYVALTSYSTLFKFGNFSLADASSKRVLILGATGGLGTFTVQLLKAYNCSISVTCSPDANEFIYKLGVDLNEIYDYKNLDNLFNNKKGYFDYILDYSSTQTTDDERKLFNLLKQNSNSYYLTTRSPLMRNADENGLIFGLLKSFKNATELTFNSLQMGTNARWTFYETNQTALEKIKELCELNKIKPIIQNIFEFDQLPLAYETVSKGHLRGKVVIKID